MLSNHKQGNRTPVTAHKVTGWMVAHVRWVFNNMAHMHTLGHLSRPGWESDNAFSIMTERGCVHLCTSMHTHTRTHSHGFPGQEWCGAGIWDMQPSWTLVVSRIWFRCHMEHIRGPHVYQSQSPFHLPPPPPSSSPIPPTPRPPLVSVKIMCPDFLFKGQVMERRNKLQSLCLVRFPAESLLLFPLL